MENLEPPQPMDNFPGEAKSASIRLGLDNYEDIFSDFDPQPYSERLLSDDFLHELKKASLDKEEHGLLLTLWVPKEKRNAAQERVISERLRVHFHRRHRKLEELRRGEKRTGIRMAVLGLCFMLLATYILSLPERKIWLSMAVVLLEPAGWFTFWEGSELLLTQVRESSPDLIFYRKMSAAKVLFAATPAVKGA